MIKIIKVDFLNEKNHPKHIFQYYDENGSSYDREQMYNEVENKPGLYVVGLGNFPPLIIVKELDGTKYVKSKNNSNGTDNLLDLPTSMS